MPSASGSISMFVELGDDRKRQDERNGQSDADIAVSHEQIAAHKSQIAALEERQKEFSGELDELRTKRSEVSQQIRDEVSKMLAAGKSRDEILDYFVARYGERILVNLKAQYAAVCDDKYNPPKAVKLFTEDAVWDGAKDFGVHRGRAAIKKFFEGVAKNIVFAVHYFLQPVIKVNKDGKTATSGKWYLWQACTLKGIGAVWIAGLEFDKYRKVNGQWLMSEMNVKARYHVSLC